MESKQAEKYINICEEVSKDVESDISDFEGKPFTGKTVAALFGYQAAAINALSNVLIEILKQIQNEQDKI